MTAAVIAAKEVLKLKNKLQKSAYSSVLISINAWAKHSKLPPFFSFEHGFHPGYRIDAQGIGYEFSWRYFPGFPVFWLEHVATGAKACFGLNDDCEQPRPRGE